MGDVGVRDRLALALDLPDLGGAVRLYRELSEHIGVAKVGLELWAAAGPATVPAFTDLGAEVFLDLKLHDIPTTVGRAAIVLGRSGARYVNFHVAGGPAMLRAAVEGLDTGAKEAGLPAPTALGVTIFTCEAAATPELLTERATTAFDAGCGGLV